MSKALLSVKDLTVRFGGVVALNNVSFEVSDGSIYAIIGPNGAGKSTLLNVITGIYSPNSGSVSFNESSISGLLPNAICKQGICRSFQNTELFSEMTVLENVLVGMHNRPSYGPFSAAIHSKHFFEIEKKLIDEAKAILGFVGLNGTENEKAASLPFGKQRKLEIARALASKPKMLLLDEPAAGLRGIEIQELKDILLRIRADFGITILLIDHVMSLVMQVSSKILVLNFGEKIFEGEPLEVRSSKKVIEAYLGERAANAIT